MAACLEELLEQSDAASVRYQATLQRSRQLQSDLAQHRWQCQPAPRPTDAPGRPLPETRPEMSRLGQQKVRHPPRPPRLSRWDQAEITDRIARMKQAAGSSPEPFSAPVVPAGAAVEHAVEPEVAGSSVEPAAAEVATTEAAEQVEHTEPLQPGSAEHTEPLATLPKSAAVQTLQEEAELSLLHSRYRAQLAKHKQQPSPIQSTDTTESTETPEVAIRRLRVEQALQEAQKRRMQVREAGRSAESEPTGAIAQIGAAPAALEPEQPVDGSAEPSLTPPCSHEQSPEPSPAHEPVEAVSDQSPAGTAVPAAEHHAALARLAAEMKVHVQAAQGASAELEQRRAELRELRAQHETTRAELAVRCRAGRG